MAIKKQKHIDIVVKYFYPVAAGIETNIMETYSTLVERGWDVTVHTSKDSLTKKNIFSDEEVVRGIKIKRYPFNKWYGYWPDIDWEKTDIVALHNFNVLPHFTIMLYSWLLKLVNRKHFALFVTPHGGFNPEWSIFGKTTAFIKKLYHFTIGSLMINLSVDGVRAVSEWERKEIVKKRVLGRKVRTISNGIEDTAFEDLDKKASVHIKKKVKKLGKYIIQVGRVYNIKNYETTIRALQYVPSDVKFVIVGPVGSDEYKKELEKLIDKLKLGKRVKFFGVIRGIDKFYLIKNAQMMVHMALWESFCNVVHEGMSQGLTCIVANNTALPLLIKDGENGYCIETKNYKKVAEKINFVLENKNNEVIQKIKRTNMKFAREHSWSKVALKMEDFYLEKINKNKYEK